MSVKPAGAYALSTIMPILGTATLAARFFVRQYKKSSLEADDWTAMVGLVGLWGVAGLILDGTRHDFIAVHSRLDPSTGGLMQTVEVPNVMYAWIIQLLTIAALMFIKLSVLLLYQRIFHVSDCFRIYALVLRCLLLLWGCGFFFGMSFSCGTHLKAFWGGRKATHKYCSNIGDLNVALSFSDVIFDLMILLAPISMIWKLHISTARKVQVLAIFALGFLSTVAAAARTYIMWNDAYGTILGFRDVLDENTKITIWCMVEIASALIGSCLPTLKPLISNSTLGSVVRSIRTTLSTMFLVKSAESNAEDGPALGHIGE